jgi:regulator of protease activity HflC (stomatin/prohibitin superfamily)
VKARVLPVRRERIDDLQPAVQVDLESGVGERKPQACEIAVGVEYAVGREDMLEQFSRRVRAHNGVEIGAEYGGVLRVGADDYTVEPVVLRAPLWAALHEYQSPRDVLEPVALFREQPAGQFAGGAENEEVTFSDNNALPMTADVQLVMRIDPEKAPALYTRYRLTFDQLFEGPIRNDVRSAIAAETELVSVEFLYRGGRQAVIQKALQRVRAKWEAQGVNVSQLDWIGTIRYPQVILDSIQMKTKADADASAAQAQVAVSKAQADAKIEEARGQAEANRLIANSIAASPGVVQLRAIEKWDGKLPQVTGSATPFIDLKTAK